ncbi:MAG: tyrosine-protein phosphatase [Solirubrobacteraceae bacterium]
MIDLHCHVLPGIDDGPVTIDESLALARAAAAGGIETIVATPHASARYPNRATTITRLVAELDARLLEEAIPVDLRKGAEIALTHVPELDPVELAALRLGDGPWLLLEPPFAEVVVGIDRTVAQLQEEGHRVVLAHPERCPSFHREPALLRALVRDGALTSITAGSLVGRFGKTVRSFANQLVDEQLVHNVASDAHGPHHRAPGIAAELGQAGLEPLSQWLTEHVPQAILAGADIPPRPSTNSATRRWWRRAHRRG